MKKNFITGLIILLPFTLTFGIIIFCIKFLTNPFLGFVESYVPFFQPAGHGLILFISRIAILCFLFILVALIGFLARLFFVKYLFHLGNALIGQIPFVNKIYAAAKEATDTLLTTPSPPFSKVVLVPFPHSRCFSLGFVIRDNGNISSLSDHVSILIPGCPNPLMGFMQVYPSSEVIPLEIGPEEGVKFIISCGIMMPERRAVYNEELS